MAVKPAGILPECRSATSRKDHLMRSHLADLNAALAARFADAPELAETRPGLETLAAMARHGSCRRFQARSVDAQVISLLAAVALSAPTKSDLQQRDIIVVREPALRQDIVALIDSEGWVAAAPVLLVFCGNNQRQRRLHDWRGRPFANDHLDAFFNAAVDAAIALAAFVTAAEALGLGCCPLSAIRNQAEAVSDLLALPDHVFPLAGLVVGWPEVPAPISQRLPLSATLHENRFSAEGLHQTVEAYDDRRRQAQPYEKQRYSGDYGEGDDYGWSEDKARQYSKPERADFGAFIRKKGFRLE